MGAQFYSDAEREYISELVETHPIYWIHKKYNRWARRNNYSRRSYGAIKGYVQRYHGTKLTRDDNWKITEIAKMLGIPRRTISGWIDSGYLEASRPCKKYRTISKAQFKAFAKNNMEKLSRGDRTGLKYLVGETLTNQIKETPQTSTLPVPIIDNLGNKFESISAAARHHNYAPSSMYTYIGKDKRSTRFRRLDAV